MFPLFRSRAALNVYKLAYCERRYKTCARYELASTGAMPDKALLPDGTMLPAHWVDPEG